MFAKLSTPQRIQTGLVFAMAFLLVLGSNRLDQKHFSNIQTAVNSVYQDRVVVQDFIYRLSTIFHGKELRFILKEDLKNATSENREIAQLLGDFKATELTSKEAALLKKLNEQFISLQRLEKNAAESAGTLSENSTLSAVKKLDEIKLSLNALAEIQLEESGQLTQLSEKSLGINSLLSKIELVFLVVIGLGMLALIFYPMKKKRAVSE